MRTFVPAALVCLGLLSGSAWAGEGRGEGHGEGRGGRMAAIADEVGLTTQQRAAVEDILYKSQAAKLDAQAKLQRAKLDLRHHLGAAQLDEGAVKKAVEAASAATSDLIRIKVDRIVAIRKQLSADQWAKLKDVWADDRDEDDDDDE